MIGGGKKTKMKSLSKKGVLAALLLITMLVGSVGAWTVLTGATGSGTRGTIEQAEATVSSAGWIELGSIGSGYSFSFTTTGTDSLTINNAKELVVTFSVTGLDTGEQAAMASGTLAITVEGLGTKTINLKALVTRTFTVAEGTWDIQYDVAGVAAYPMTDVPVDFRVLVTVTTP